MKLLISGLLLLVIALQVEAGIVEHRRVKRGQQRIGTPVDIGIQRVEVQPVETVVTKRIEYHTDPTIVRKYVKVVGGDMSNVDLSNIDLSKFQLGGVKVVQGEPIVRKYTMRQVQVVPGMEQQVFNVAESYVHPLGCPLLAPPTAKPRTCTHLSEPLSH
ncbi:hypothetical protein Y032_0116g612 [Ancylostoma ceylanicum]|uniref:Uncharacterized protein n=1 Tax=Ancylostoma ceylanicum TaxID=53326 RepID=A0A016TCP9_9BILA|nr:hypothetical protein Y032_0116g612 [Ancylostoma ceylanicum]